MSDPDSIFRVSSDVRALAHKCFDMPLTESEVAKLQDHLKSNENAQRLYCELALMSADLVTRQKADIACKELQIEFRENRGQSASQSPMLVRTGRRVLQTMRAVPLSTAAAVLMIGAILGGGFGFLLRSEITPAERTSFVETSGSEPPIVATLSETQNCVWAPGTDALPSGHHFTLGSSLHLLSGAAQITFETGVVSIIEGPAQLTLFENGVELFRGRVSAVVPESGRLFTVLTPLKEVIDLGTEFGVSVDASGTSEVHVFSGEVVTRSRNAAGEVVGKLEYVTTQNAIRFGPDSKFAERLKADEAAFIRMLHESDIETANLLLPVEGRLSLWLTSNQWIVDEEQRVKVWRDAPTSNRTILSHALQPEPDSRPLVVSKDFNGYSALRFDGINDFLVTTPFHSGSNQTVALVASIRPSAVEKRRAVHERVQIINYNGPPQIDMRKFAGPNLLNFIATLDDHGRARLNPYVYMGALGRVENQEVVVGNVSTHSEQLHGDTAPFANEPFVAIYVYDHDDNRAELWVNNRLTDQDTAPATIDITTRKVIGRHGEYKWWFTGDIAEVMIYDEALPHQSIEQLGRYLADKYGVPH